MATASRLVVRSYPKPAERKLCGQVRSTQPVSPGKEIKQADGSIDEESDVRASVALEVDVGELE